MGLLHPVYYTNAHNTLFQLTVCILSVFENIKYLFYQQNCDFYRNYGFLSLN